MPLLGSLPVADQSFPTQHGQPCIHRRNHRARLVNDDQLGIFCMECGQLVDTITLRSVDDVASELL